jgi:2-(1,2-epoxy-1,2-dihydrophenyl)acetyl-CoA isomerase
VPEEAVLTSLLVDDREGVRTFTMNRPESFNSLTVELKEALRDGLAEAGADDAVRAVVLTGAGKAFCAGQDLKEHVAALRADDPAPFRTVAEHYNPIVRTITSMGKPVIAAVNGMAAGAGASFAYACDLRIAAPKAKFLMAFATIGLTADSGASWTLPRLVGYGRAMELMLLAKAVTAEQALAMGMVTEVAEDALATAQELASRMATGPTTGYGKIKEALLAAAGADLEHALHTEGEGQALLGATEDHREAVDAFVAKRTPTFTGR